MELRRAVYRHTQVIPALLPTNHGDAGTNYLCSLDGSGLVGGSKDATLGVAGNGLGDGASSGVPDLGGENDLHFESFALLLVIGEL